jgi:polyhydroxybutyrate depolymerase
MSRIVFEIFLATFACIAGAVVCYMVYDHAPATDGQVLQPALRPVQPEQVPDDEEYHLTHAAREYRYLVHRPLHAKGSALLPLVLNFHGLYGRAESQVKQSKMNELSDRHGFLLVYPEGTIRSYNAGICCGYAHLSKLDDVGYARRLLDDLIAKFPVDPQRVYATGFSNGAMLCYRLACELPNRFAAIAPVSGDMGVDGPKPTRPIPILHIHGLDDPIVPFEGGTGKNEFQPYRHRSITDTIMMWLNWNNCSKIPVELKKSKDWTMTRWAPAQGQYGAPVILYTLPEGGHTWPGGVEVLPGNLSGKLVESLNASALIWEFLEPYRLEDPSLAKKK